MPLTRRKIAPSSRSATTSLAQPTSRCAGLGGSSSSITLQSRSKTFLPISPATSPVRMLIGAKRSFIAELGFEDDLDRPVFLLLEHLVGTRRLGQGQPVGGQVIDAKRVLLAFEQRQDLVGPAPHMRLAH